MKLKRNIFAAVASMSQSRHCYSALSEKCFERKVHQQPRKHPSARQRPKRFSLKNHPHRRGDLFTTITILSPHPFFKASSSPKKKGLKLKRIFLNSMRAVGRWWLGPVVVCRGCQAATFWAQRHHLAGHTIITLIDSSGIDLRHFPVVTQMDGIR